MKQIVWVLTIFLLFISAQVLSGYIMDLKTTPFKEGDSHSWEIAWIYDKKNGEKTAPSGMHVLQFEPEGGLVIISDQGLYGSSWNWQNGHLNLKGVNEDPYLSQLESSWKLEERSSTRLLLVSAEGTHLALNRVRP